MLFRSSTILEAYSGDSDHPLGVSIGIAAFDPESGETLKQLIARADAAMYLAKDADKAGCAVAPPAAEADRKEQDQ